MNYYQRLKDLREDKDLTQKAIAEQLGIRQEQYCLYENGKRTMRIYDYVALADYYDVSMDYITGRTNNKKGLYKPTTEEEIMLKKFRSLDSESKGKLLERLDVLCEKNN